MSRATVELDFFGMEKDNSKSQFQKFLDRQRSFRGIQGAISKMNPELIKSVIASGSAGKGSWNKTDSMNSLSVPSTPKETQTLFPSLPVLSPASRATSENNPETAPFTIFYNGTVSVFNVPRHKAESILKLAVEGCSRNAEPTDSKPAVPPSNQQQPLESLDGDLPILARRLARKKSLQSFLEKRKERLTSVSPYIC